MCFGGSSQPAPQPLPAQPTTDDESNLQRVQDEKRKALNAQGLGATVLTSGLGATGFEEAGKTKSTILLGQSAGG